MKNSGKYIVPNIEDYEPDSNNTVLKNKMSIKDVKEIEIIETENLRLAIELLAAKFTIDHKFSAKDLCFMHKKWLEKIYYFSGRYRTVNMSKDNFLFANPNLIPQLMNVFEHKVLKKYTPCNGSIKEVARAIAVVHTEFILIHPFREGNGRIARVLASLMSAQAGYPLLDFSPISQEANNKDIGFHSYIKAIHEGVEHNYETMIMIFETILKYSISVLIR